MTNHPSLQGLAHAIESQDAQQVAACFAEDYEVEAPRNPSLSFRGRATVLRNWQFIFDRLRDVEVTIVRSTEHDDEIWAEWLIRGRADDGGPEVMVGVTIWRLDSAGLIRSARFYLEPVDARAAKPF